MTRIPKTDLQVIHFMALLIDNCTQKQTASAKSSSYQKFYLAKDSDLIHV